jgi:uncharacterized protein YndB with AHSA1/START domain
MKVTVETLVQAPLTAAWRAYTTPEDIVQWNAASEDWHTTRAEVDLKVGGAFLSRMEAKDGSVGFDFSGVYTRVEPETLFEYEFGGRRALIEFAASGTGTLVRVRFDPEDENPVEMQREGWQSILNNFARHVETNN